MNTPGRAPSALARARSALLALLLAGCGYDATPVAAPAPAEVPEPPTPAAPQECGDPTRSYEPGGSIADLRSGEAVRRILSKRRLVAGVSADSYLLGSRDPITGRIEGFDIDMVRQVALAIFGGDLADIDDRITLRVITAADRLPALQEGRVDLVARNMTINCDRWKEIAFSAVYYLSGQKLLVRSDLATTGVDTVDELAGLRVCAPSGTTSLANIAAQAPDDTVLVQAATHTGCLVKFQRGEVDAITGDDTVLAGLAAQDPYAVIPAGQQAFTAEPYGIGVNQDDVDLARLVNAVLEKMRRDGSWQRSYDTWLRPTLDDQPQPQPTYGRPAGGR